jgi:TolB-like protein/DNA-binding winged helix-turn-helix (wHTH) protein/Tfp pilus assembly protein PilF
MKHEKGTNPQEFLAIGAIKYDRTTGTLTNADGTIVHMRRQSADVLAVLARSEGEIVGKETLIDSVWPGIATTDDSLIQCIADIRRTLGRDAVETFPKKGYRLRSNHDADAGRRTSARGRRLRVALAGCLLATAVGAAWVSWPVRPGDEGAIVPPVVSQEQTLAVLPFVNLSGDPDLSYFSDGLSEDLTTDLSKVVGLTVISQASSFDFRNAESGFGEIAQDLGVRYLVRGTVRRYGDRVRINVALVDSRDGFNLWTERFDTDTQDPFSVQDSVLRQIVRALSLTLDIEEPPSQRTEPDAYDMLLRGLEPFREYTAAGNIEARAYFERALKLDPEYARAYAYIAITYGRETVFRYSDEISRPSIQKGLEAAITAIRLDPARPDAYFALGMLNLALGEYDNALAAARHSIRLDGNYSDGYALLGEVAVHGGDLDEALTAIRRAKLLHPHYPFSYDWIEGHILFQLGRYDEAEPLLEAAVEGNPGFYRGLITLAANFGQQGNASSAGKALAAALAINPDLALDREAAQTPYRFEERRRRLADGLRLAGLKRQERGGTRRSRCAFRSCVSPGETRLALFLTGCPSAPLLTSASAAPRRASISVPRFSTRLSAQVASLPGGGGPGIHPISGS